MTVHEERAGTVDGVAVRRAVLRSDRIEAGILAYGATLQWLRVRDGSGQEVDVALGYDTVEDYAREPGYLGATVGRFGNRIAGGRFTLDGREHRLTIGPSDRHQLHGGPGAFAHRVWDMTLDPDSDGVRFDLVSPDGDNGYPGEVRASTTYRLHGNDLHIEMTATTTAPTPVNLVNHTYWNVAGSGTIDGQELQLMADRFVEVDAELIPTGRIVDVDGGPLDFRRPKRLDHAGAPEIDHCFVVRGEGLWPVAVLRDPVSGRRLELSADQPGVQVYAAMRLDVPSRGGGRSGARAGLCLETEAFPDAPNRPHFPSCILRPGQTYRHRMVARLSTAS